MHTASQMCIALLELMSKMTTSVLRDVKQNIVSRTASTVPCLLVVLASLFLTVQ